MAPGRPYETHSARRAGESAVGVLTALPVVETLMEKVLHHDRLRPSRLHRGENMTLTQQQAQERADMMAREFEKLSYKDLLACYRTHCEDPNALSVFEDHPEGELFIDVDIGELGHFQKRVSVEIVVTGDGWEKWDQPGCVWFERFASGKLRRHDGRTRRVGVRFITYGLGVFFILGGVIWAIACLW